MKRLATLILLTAAACGAGRSRATSAEAPPPAPVPPPKMPVAEIPAPRLPGAPAQFAPSHMAIAGGVKLSGEVQADVKQCGGCHADVVADWKSSAHSFASFGNPIYRVAVERLRADKGAIASRFCAGCHDVPLLLDGVMDEPSATAIRPDDARAHGGVTCRTCHGIEAVDSDGNGSFVLSSADIPFPVEGDADSVARHKERVAMAPLRTAKVCGSCHRAFLGTDSGNAFHLNGQDDIGPWARSIYSGSELARIDDEDLPQQSCQGCHMPRVDATRGDVSAKQGKIRSHRFVGGHTWLAAMRGDAETLRQQQAMLRGAASIDVAAAIHEDGRRTLPADGAEVVAGERLELDVVVRNTRVGHRFPGGVLDAQDVWIELVVSDAHGQLLAEAGTRQEQDGGDPTAHRLIALVAGDDGKPLWQRETHEFRTAVFNHTLLPRDAIAVRYGFDVPADLSADALPLQVTARLRHRTRNLTLQAGVCEESRTSRGKAFARATWRFRRARLDPCRPQPVTEIAASAVWIGAGSEARVATVNTTPRWRRLYEHGMAVAHAVQERLDEARPSLEGALVLLRAGAGTDRDQAMVLCALADVSLNQGRTAEALDLIDRAAVLAPGHPTLARLRGDAYAMVWRWNESLAPLREAAAASPKDSSSWIKLAIALGSAGDDAGALHAAITGLALLPRDADMLRVQALALAALGAPADRVAAAHDASLRYRLPDDAPAIRAACSDDVPGCALEREPFHTHEMRGAIRR